MRPTAIIASAILLALSLAAPLRADQRLVLFQKKANVLIGKRVHWSHPNHPIGPYIGTFFEEGLGKQEQLDLHDAHRRVDCIGVEVLLIKGFHKLYPFLKPAFAYMDMSTTLEVALLSSSAGAAQWRCIHRQMLQSFLVKRRLSDYPIIDMKRELEKQRRRRGLKQKETELDELTNIRFAQADAAFCDDYPPDMLDVLQIANKRGGLLLTPEEELFLLERARALGHETLSYDEDIARVSARITDKRALERLQTASRNRPFAHIANVPGYWHRFCQVIR